MNNLTSSVILVSRAIENINKDQLASGLVLVLRNQLLANIEHLNTNDCSMAEALTKASSFMTIPVNLRLYQAKTENSIFLKFKHSSSRIYVTIKTQQIAASVSFSGYYFLFLYQKLSHKNMCMVISLQP